MNMIPVLAHVAIATGGCLISKLPVFNFGGSDSANQIQTAIDARQQVEAERDHAIRNHNDTNVKLQLTEAQLVISNQATQNATLQFQQAAISVNALQRNLEQISASAVAERATNAARFAAENTTRLATEEARKKVEEAEEGRQRTQAAKEGARRAAEAAEQDAKRLQRAVDEEKERADEAVAEAEAAGRAAENDVREATAAKEGAERRLREGIQPVVTPTPQEILAAKANVQYQENLFHFAVAGRAGAGKSSLVNAFRGMSNREAGSARVGITETTLTLGRYPDADEGCHHVWYDLPGAGTIKVPDWQYFNAQGLYVFNCIIVLFDNRFTQTDIAILLNCRRFKIPTYIVRSKADQHIRNMVKEMGYNSDDENVDRTQRPALYKAAREQLMDETRHNVKANLAEANLPDQKVYVVSKKYLRAVAKGEQPKRVIDEIHLVHDLYAEAQPRYIREGALPERLVSWK